MRRRLATLALLAVSLPAGAALAEPTSVPTAAPGAPAADESDATPAGADAGELPAAGGELRIVTQPRPGAVAPSVSPATEPAAVDASEVSAAPGAAPARPATARTADPTAETLDHSEWPELLLRANQAYEAGEYEQAAEQYTRLVDSGARNGHLLYNLGNCRVRLGQLGRGIAAYLAAARLLPRDQDVRANLDYARQSRKDALEPIAPSALLTTLFFWHYGLSLRETLLLAGAVSVLFWLGLAIRLVRRESEALRWGVVGLGLVLLALTGSLVARVAWDPTVAVVVRPELKVRSGMSREATVLFELHEGTEAEVLDREDEGGWVKIRLADDKRGWLRADGIVVVD